MLRVIYRYMCTDRQSYLHAERYLLCWSMDPIQIVTVILPWAPPDYATTNTLSTGLYCLCRFRPAMQCLCSHPV